MRCCSLVLCAAVLRATLVAGETTVSTEAELNAAIDDPNTAVIKIPGGTQITFSQMAASGSGCPFRSAICINRALRIEGLGDTMDSVILNAGCSASDCPNGARRVVSIKDVGAGQVEFVNLRLEGGTSGPNSDGAGVLVEGSSDVTFDSVEIHDNSAVDGWGGGVGVTGYSGVRFVSSDIKSNQAGWGGGVHVDGSSSVRFESCTIRLNVASRTTQDPMGAGFYVDAGSTVELIDTTFSGNAWGGGSTGWGVDGYMMAGSSVCTLGSTNTEGIYTDTGLGLSTCPAPSISCPVGHAPCSGLGSLLPASVDTCGSASQTCTYHTATLATKCLGTWSATCASCIPCDSEDYVTGCHAKYELTPEEMSADYRAMVNDWRTNLGCADEQPVCFIDGTLQCAHWPPPPPISHPWTPPYPPPGGGGGGSPGGGSNRVSVQFTTYFDNMSELAAIQSAIELMFSEMFTLQGYDQITVTLEAVTRRRRLESGSVNVNVAIVFATAAEATSAANDLNNGALSSPAALQSRLNNQFQSGPSPLGITTTVQEITAATTSADGTTPAGNGATPAPPPAGHSSTLVLPLAIGGAALGAACICLAFIYVYCRRKGRGLLLSNPRAGARTGVEAHTQSTAERAMSVVSHTAQQQQMQQMQMQMQAAPPQQITVVIPPGLAEGALFQASTPNGMATCQVPPGCVGGQQVTVNIPSSPPPLPQQQQRDGRTRDLKTRVADIPTNDGVMVPIKGVRGAASMSLMDAAMVTGLDSVSADAFIASERGAELARTDTSGLGLTADEAAALTLYTMEGAFYKRLNELLRARERAGLQPFYPFLRLMLEARDKLPRYAGVVWRGVQGVDLRGDFPKGKEFYWWAFSSTSKELSTLQSPQFMGTSGVRTIFNIQVRGGVDVSRYNLYDGGEAEVLLYPGTKLVVIDNMEMGGGLFMVHLKEIEVPVTLID